MTDEKAQELFNNGEITLSQKLNIEAKK